MQELEPGWSGSWGSFHQAELAPGNEEEGS